ncbi:hypothetical protein, partial [uncultured Lamprocystis sp.]
MNSQAAFSLDRDDDTLTKEDRRPQETPDDTAGPRSIRSHVVRWMREDWPYLAMLLLAVVGVALQLPAIYWIFVMPVYLDFGHFCLRPGAVHGWAGPGPAAPAEVAAAGDRRYRLKSTKTPAV